MAAVAGFLPSSHGLHFPNSFPHEPDLKIDIANQEIPIGDAANGLCGGFVYTVIDLWEARLPPPADTTPPAGGSPLFTYLVGRLFDSFDLPWGPAEYLALMNPALPDHETWIEPLGHGRAWRMIKNEWPKIKRHIDDGTLCPLGLIRIKSLDPTKLGHNHQVLAYAYDLNGTTLTLHIYDPNSPDDDSVRLSLDISHPEHTTPVTYTADSEPVFCFFVTAYSFHDPSAIAGHAARPAPPRKLTAAAHPFAPGFDKPVQIEVTAHDAATHDPVAGEVLISGTPVAATNTKFTYTFHRQHRPTSVHYDTHDGPKRVVYQDYPAGTIRAAGYTDTAVLFGPPTEDGTPPPERPGNVHVPGTIHRNPARTSQPGARRPR